tara:strand:- start:2076 stop:2216 length:141 start_codon:yes stop_codon:yes gene_type:complete
MANRGRPVGTTKKAGFKVSSGRPRKKISFFGKVVKGFHRIFCMKGY